MIRNAARGGVLTLTLACALALPLAGGSGQLPGPTGVPSTGLQAGRAPAPTGAISGEVIDAQTGAPVAGADVTLTTDDRRVTIGSGPTSQLTDSRGRFAFINLGPSSTYRLTATRPGYLDSGAQRDPRTQTIPLSDGEWIADVRVALLRAGSISGVVVDERGDPVVGTRVRALALIAVAGRERLAAGPTTVTDDRGAYRLGSLRPGRYVILVPSTQATVPASTTAARIAGVSESGPVPVEQTLAVDGRARLVLGALVPPPPRDGRLMGYPMTFHSGASRIDQTTPIDLAAGEERRGVDLRIQPMATATISGQLVTPPTMRLVALIRLVAAGLEDLGFGSEVATTLPDANGEFVFLNVPSGSYVVDVTPSVSEYGTVSRNLTDLPRIPGTSGGGLSVSDVPVGPPGTTHATFTNGASISGFSARVPVVVDGADQAGVRLELKPTGSISGRTVVENDPGGVQTTPSRVLMAEPAGGEPALGRSRDGREPGGPQDVFYVTGLLPGEYLMRGPQQPGWLIKSIVHDGRDYTDRPFDIASVPDYEHVTITFTNKVAKLSGAVRVEPGSAADPAAVIVFPADAALWTNYGLRPIRIQSQLVSPRNTFMFDALPAGDYLVVAVRSNDDALWSRQGFFAKLRGAATPVSLAWGDARSVSLDVVDLRQGGR
jgi:hypothetical protein